MIFRHEFISAWPYPATTKRVAGAVKGVRNEDIRTDLEHAFRMLGAHEIVFRTGVHEGFIGADGWPIDKHWKQHVHPGAIVEIRSRVRPALRFHCDRFAWLPANLRAISLTLAALRGVGQFGACDDEQQYDGFKVHTGEINGASQVG